MFTTLAPALAALLIQTAPPDDAMVPARCPMSVQRGPAAVSEVNAVLDAMHAAAARADGVAYFALFAPFARFIGTDAAEHWSLAQFRAYADPIFAEGRGWTYRPHDRTVTSVGDVFVFDEKLDNDSYGEMRGSGVLSRDAAGQLKIDQYVLSFTVPNARSDAVVAAIKGKPVEAEPGH